jgi:predicted XRE-type DNA-binding protein
MQKSYKSAKSKKSKPWIEGSGNIFKDIGFSDAEAANLFARGILLLELRQVIKKKRWTQAQAARALGVKQPRIAEIVGFKTECFSVDLLFKYLARIGKRVELKVKDMPRAA